MGGFRRRMERDGRRRVREWGEGQRDHVLYDASGGKL